jgi:P4 family phage/plasmid primase-like protien
MILIDIAQLDADPFSLNTPGATYDLRRGMRGARERQATQDYITRCTAVSPSDEGAELWDKFLLSVFVGDRALIDYVQRVAGVCAIGKIFVEQIIISRGDGRNGKSSFWNPIIKAFGSYAGFMSSEALTANCRHNVRPEIAEMRVVLARELQEGKRLDASFVKKICSADMILGEQKYKSPFTFIPSHTAIMYTNFLPKIGSSDAGTRRRLCVVAFTAKFETRAGLAGAR